MNRVAVRLQRKIRRNVGSSPRTKLELVAFETGAVYQYYRNGLVYKIVPHEYAKLDAAWRESLKLTLHEHGFTEVNEGELFVRGSLTLERFNRLFPKSRIGVVPNTPKEKT
jgi:hypothetical protein